MLRVKFWRIENVVLMKVLEQGDEIARGKGVFFESDCSFVLSSHDEPRMFQENIRGEVGCIGIKNYIFVGGTSCEFDNKVVAYELGNELDAVRFYDGAINAIKQYNRRINPVDNSDIQEIESVIAE